MNAYAQIYSNSLFISHAQPARAPAQPLLCLCCDILASDFWENVMGQMGMVQSDLLSSLQVLLAQSLCFAKKLLSVPSSFASRLSHAPCRAFS